jgi:preprotein translocase subunit SecA
MEADDIKETIDSIREEVFDNLISQFIPPGSIDEMWDPEGLQKALEGEFGIEVPITRWLDEDEDLAEEGLRERIMEAVHEHYRAKEEMVGASVMRQFEKALMLSILDQHWKEHLASMDYLRRSVGLRSFAQKKPQQEYKREGFEMFTAMLDNMKHDVMRGLARVQVRGEDDVQAVDQSRRRETPMQFQHAEAQPATADAAPAAGGQQAAARGQAQGQAQGQPSTPEPFVREGRKIGRNEPCPCGSGKKYKQCHGKLS